MNEHAILSTYAATLFALLNPLGMLPIFIGYTTGLAANVERWLALLVAVTVTALMLVFLLTGSQILHFFGITLDAFRMAGGILLLLMGIQIVTGNPVQAAREMKEQAHMSSLGEAKSIYRQIVIPFAMPLLVGPGVIANLILYSTESERIGKASLTLGLVGITIGVGALALLILLSGRFLERIVGTIGLGILTRILGLLVAAIGMQFVVTGTSDVIIHTIAPEILKLH